MCLFYFLVLSQLLYLSLFFSLSVSPLLIEIARDRLVLRFSLDFFGVTAALGRGPCSLIEGSIEKKCGERSERVAIGLRRVAWPRRNWSNALTSRFIPLSRRNHLVQSAFPITVSIAGAATFRPPALTALSTVVVVVVVVPSPIASSRLNNELAVTLPSSPFGCSAI